MKKLIVLVISIILLSCGEKKTVQLPEIENGSITEVLDISPIYMFYNEETDSIEFNRKNIIGTTNWLVNIDKRLTLEQVLPHLQYLQEKRHSEGMHNNKNAKNYFTCHDTTINNLGFIEFTDVDYHTDKSIKNFSTGLYKEAVILDFPSNSLNFEKTIEDFIDIIHSTPEQYSSKNHVILEFKKTITFQNYITAKSILSEMDIKNLTISKDEFIY